MLRVFKKHRWQVVMQRVLHGGSLRPLKLASSKKAANGVAFISRLPTELLAMIIAEAWSLSLSTFERIHLMTSLPCVCRRWFFVLHYLASMAIYIPSGPYYRHLLSVLTSEETFTHHPKHIRALSHPCKSVNLLVDEEYAFAARTESGMTSFLLGGMGNLLPNLRTINIAVRHPIFTGMFVLPAGLMWGRMPWQVTDLNLRWDTGSRRGGPRPRLRLPRHAFMMDSVNGSNFPHIRRMSMTGAPSTQIIADFVARCPKLEILQVDARLEPCFDHSCTGAHMGIACTPLLVVQTELLDGTLVGEWEAHLISSKDGLLTYKNIESLCYDDVGNNGF